MLNTKTSKQAFRLYSHNTRVTDKTAVKLYEQSFVGKSDHKL